MPEARGFKTQGAHDPAAWLLLEALRQNSEELVRRVLQELLENPMKYNEIT